MVEISGVVQWGGWIIGLFSGGIIIYKYYLKRPFVFLQVKALSTLGPEHQLPLRFSVVNDGRDFGEDVSIEIVCEDMNLVSQNDRIDGDSQPVPEKVLGTFSNYDQTVPPLIHALEADEEGEATVDEDKLRRTDRIIFHINDIVYPNLSIQFTARVVELLNDSGKITYTVACRSHQPREGTIEFQRDGDDVLISSTKPTFRRRLKRRVMGVFSR